MSESPLNPRDAEISKNVRKLMNQFEDKAADLAKKISTKLLVPVDKTHAKLSNYINNKVRWKNDFIDAIATIYGVTTDELMGRENIYIDEESEKRLRNIPVFASVGCGAYTGWETQIDTETVIDDNRSLFKVTARGDSMQNEIKDGDMLYCEKRKAKIDREIVVVSFQTEPDMLNATAKYIYWLPDNKIMLTSENTFYKPTIHNISEVFEIFSVYKIERLLKTRRGR